MEKANGKQCIKVIIEPLNMAQALFIRAVIMPEIADILDFYNDDLMELVGSEED